VLVPYNNTFSDDPKLVINRFCRIDIHAINVALRRRQRPKREQRKKQQSRG
jgi:hypothetical protein